jgi:hypothetical protein
MHMYIEYKAVNLILVILQVIYVPTHVPVDTFVYGDFNTLK